MQVKLPCTARPQVHCMAGRGSAMGLLGRHGSSAKPALPELSVPSGFCALSEMSLPRHVSYLDNALGGKCRHRSSPKTYSCAWLTKQ